MPARGSGERCKLLQLLSHFAALYPRKTHMFICKISASLVNIAVSGKIKANPGSGRIWNLLATYRMATPSNQRRCYLVERVFSLCGTLSAGHRNRMNSSLDMRSFFKLNATCVDFKDCGY